MKGINTNEGCITVKFNYREPMGIDKPDACKIYEFTSFEEYKNLMFLVYSFLVCLNDYLKEVDDIHVKQRKSKKKSR